MTRHLQVCTSASHPLRIDWLDAPARVGMTLAPGVRATSSAGFRWERDLDADLDVIRESGATALVTLLEDHEFALYGIEALVPKAQARRLEVLRLPIRDVSVPDDLATVERLLAEVAVHEARGGRLVIHCRGGLGRTGTIAGCYLVRNGVSPADALAMLQRVRQTRDCPQTTEQRAFIERYARAAAPRPPAANAAAAAKTTPTAAPWYATVLAGLPGTVQAVTAGGSKREADELLARIEREVAASPESAFTFAEDGEATLTAAGRSYGAGRFTTPTLGELRARLAARPKTGGGRLVLSVLQGAHPLTDIGTLQATAAPGTLFQVASQFDCLEAPGPHLVPVQDYLYDSTQGPRASVSAFPGTFLRHYRAPAADGSRFVQTDERCLNLLADVFDDAVAEVRGGYLQAARIRDPAALAEALVERFDQVRVGLHADVEVVYGHDWSGPVPAPAPRISQVFKTYGRIILNDFQVASEEDFRYWSVIYRKWIYRDAAKLHVALWDTFDPLEVTIGPAEYVCSDFQWPRCQTRSVSFSVRIYSLP